MLKILRQNVLFEMRKILFKRWFLQYKHGWSVLIAGSNNKCKNLENALYLAPNSTKL